MTDRPLPQGSVPCRNTDPDLQAARPDRDVHPPQVSDTRLTGAEQ